MRGSRSSTAALLLLVLFTGAAFAAQTVADTPKTQPAHELALFSVPKLLEGTTLTDLAGALAKESGVVSAQADSAKDSFKVTFETKTTDPNRLLKAVTSVAKDAKLVAVMPAGAKAAAKDCGNCPHAKGCAGAKKS